MTKFLIIMFFLVCENAFSQYPFERYKSPKIESHTFKMSEQDRDLIYTLDINNFYENETPLRIKVSGKLNEYDKTNIEIDSRQYFETIATQGVNDFFIGDFNGDGMKDIKLSIFYMGSGLGSMRIRVIYFFQKQNKSFTKVSFDDMQEGNRIERDINSDGNYEIITMSLNEFKNHNYWTFNLYNFTDDKLVCVNEKFSYPIMIQFLYRENFKITNNLTRNEMKQFSVKQPDELSIEK